MLHIAGAFKLLKGFADGSSDQLPHAIVIWNEKGKGGKWHHHILMKGKSQAETHEYLWYKILGSSHRVCRIDRQNSRFYFSRNADYSVTLDRKLPDDGQNQRVHIHIRGEGLYYLIQALIDTGHDDICVIVQNPKESEIRVKICGPKNKGWSKGI